LLHIIVIDKYESIKHQRKKSIDTSAIEEKNKIDITNPPLLRKPNKLLNGRKHVVRKYQRHHYVFPKKDIDLSILLV